MSGIVHQLQRLYYVEPNDVYDADAGGGQQGLALTPKYEDMCISFNLIIESFRRLNASGVSKDNTGETNSNEPKKYIIEWGISASDMVKKRTSLLKGNMGTFDGDDPDNLDAYHNKDYNFLTTYFTDINYSSYREKTEIEGLGVESVQVSYESWYTPTVTIKFVDVRGSSLFGREEAIHTNEKLTSENVFGAFFTMPYPLFRLQIKGFFGKPVTYQLTCSSFKGEFNSQTGNFEAVAQFIGYSWSLLTDIPFVYLVAAPNAPYIGIDYWNSHVNTEDWALWDGEGGQTVPPPKLIDLYRNIEKAMPKNEGNYSAQTNDENERLQGLSNERNLLNKISTTLNTFKSEFTASKKQFEDSYIEVFDTNEKTHQMMLFSSVTDWTIPQETIDAYNNYVKTLEEYQTNYPSRDINDSLKPTFEMESGVLKLINLFSVDENAKIVVDDSHNTVEKLKKTELNNVEDRKNMSGAMASLILNGVLGENINKNIKQNAYLIDFGNISELVNDRKDVLDDEERRLNKEINDRINYNINDIVDCKPFIGNIFKIIFCHLETFCHIMFKAHDEIKAQTPIGHRKASYLGISDDCLDIVKDTTADVVPWPAVYDQGKKNEQCGYTSDYPNIYGWVGDLNHRWEEEKVVYSLQEGIQQLAKQRNPGNRETQETGFFPVAPYDFAIEGGPFQNIGNLTSISDVAGYLALRMANVLGVLTEGGASVADGGEMAKLFGKMDSYNLFLKMANQTTFDNVFGKNELNLNLLKDIIHCKEGGDNYGTIAKEGTNERYHKFETVKRIYKNYTPFEGKRHPMFFKENGVERFVHWYNNKWISFVPSGLREFSSYKKEFDYIPPQSENGIPYFDVNYFNMSSGNIETFDCIYNTDTGMSNIVNQDSKNGFLNRYMFNVRTESDFVDKVQRKAEWYKSEGLKVENHEIKDDFNTFVKRYMKVTKNDRFRFFDNITHMLCGNLNKINYDKKNLLPNDFNSNLAYNFKENSWYNYRNLKITDDLEYKLNNEDISDSDVVVQDLKVIYVNNEKCNIFGCPFYYAQNEQKNELKKDENGNEVNYENKDVLRLKALLFLHTFRYDFKNVKLNVFSKDKKNGGLESVPKAYLLLLGGLLWKKRVGSNIKYKYTMTNNYSFKVKAVNETFFVQGGTKHPNHYFFYILKNDDSRNYLKISDVFTDGIENIDKNIENHLIGLFTKFVENEYTQIAEKYELKHRTDNGLVDYDFAGVRSAILKLQEVFKNYTPLYGTVTYNEKREAIVNPNSSGELNRDDTLENCLKENGIDNILGTYSAIYAEEGVFGMSMLFKEDDDMKKLKNLYTDMYVIFDSCHRRLSDTDGTAAAKQADLIYVNETAFDAYLNGFIEGVNNLKSENSVAIGDDEELQISEDTIKNRDLSISIYYYLKNLWDRWLVIANEDAFNVKNFFMENFIFIDSFYRNTYRYLAVNCDEFLRIWNDKAEEASMFTVLSEVVSRHHCLFLPVPDYVGFKGLNQEDDIEMMENLFRPLPYNEMAYPSNSNKFVVIYTQPYASHNDTDNAYPVDNFDIWSYNDGTPVEGPEIKNLFKTTNDPDFDRKRDIATREGYNVPSFGVSFGRQNNHLFKSLKCSMDNPVVTEQAIKAQWNIAKMGSGGGKKVCFVGQDIFNVFSNYSYSVTVEMMGNAQICPLMYFQLFNVPMWRGTYMIYKVQHSMTPGNMITTFTGMKMSKYSKPFNSTFFSICSNNQGDPSSSGSDGGGSSCGVSNDYNDPNVNLAYESKGIFYNPKKITNLSKFCILPNEDLVEKDAGGKIVRDGDYFAKLKVYKTDNNQYTRDKIEGQQGVDLISEVEVDTMKRDSSGNYYRKKEKLKMNLLVHTSIKEICEEICKMVEEKKFYFEFTFYTPNGTNMSWRSYNSVETERLSRHCLGLAVDVNHSGHGNPYFNADIPTNFEEPQADSKPIWGMKKNSKGAIAPYYGTYNSGKCHWHWKHPVVQIFLKHGWGWGGSYGDVMHFSATGGN